jgi:hypothetical protein
MNGRYKVLLQIEFQRLRLPFVMSFFCGGWFKSQGPRRHPESDHVVCQRSHLANDSSVPRLILPGIVPLVEIERVQVTKGGQAIGVKCSTNDHLHTRRYISSDHFTFTFPIQTH